MKTSSRQINAIIWDMGGVLLRTENLQPEFEPGKKAGGILFNPE